MESGDTPMKTKLTIELVPRGQWGANLRSELPKAEWDRLRRDVYAAAGHRCEICGGRGPKWPVECHERWRYDEETKIQHLEGLIALCPACHRVKHMGRSMSIGRGEEALAHLMKVNGWSESDANHYVEAVFETWSRRSSENWTLDLSWLQSKEVAT